MYESRIFKLLIGTSTVVALLLGMAVFRTVLAGCPDGHSAGVFACFFLPTNTDLSTHLLSYVFIGTIALGIPAGLLLWRRQWTKIRLITMNLALLQAPEEELRPLVYRLGLKGKICVVNSEALLCFCAGFISPRIYISNGMIAILTPEELEALVLHEKHHLSNHVPLKILIGKCIALMLVFIPLLQDFLQHYLIEMEIAADDSAIRQQGHSRGIAGALKKLVHQYSTIPVPSSAVGATDALVYRIDHLTGPTKSFVFSFHVSRIVTSLIVTAFILTTILIPLPSSHPISGHLASTVSIYLGQGIGL